MRQLSREPLGRTTEDNLDILDTIQFDRLIVQAMEYNACSACKFVDTDLNRTAVNRPCPQCSVPSEGGTGYFDPSILSIVDLLQEAYCAIGTPPTSRFDYPMESERAHTASVVIFFCTLAELLLERLLSYRMEAMGLPAGVVKQLTFDNDTHSLRLTKLFPSLIGERWLQVLERIDPDKKKQYILLSSTVKEITKKRNGFVHAGNDWDMRKDIAELCLKSLFPMLDLFVELNNALVHPLMLSKMSASNHCQ